jgi:hypothetical protein
MGWYGAIQIWVEDTMSNWDIKPWYKAEAEDAC